jgi:hypothetical protein
VRPVRLSDISPKVRLAAARRLARGGDPDAAGLLTAAMFPRAGVSGFLEDDAGLEFVTSAGAGIVGGGAESGLSRTEATLPTDPEFGVAA